MKIIQVISGLGNGGAEKLVVEPMYNHDVILTERATKITSLLWRNDLTNMKAKIYFINSSDSYKVFIYILLR